MSMKAGRPFVLSLFDYTGTMVRPWAEAGYPCIIVDIQHPEGERTEGNITRAVFEANARAMEAVA